MTIRHTIANDNEQTKWQQPCRNKGRIEINFISNPKALRCQRQLYNVQMRTSMNTLQVLLQLKQALESSDRQHDSEGKCSCTANKT